MVAESSDRRRVGRHGVIGEVALTNLRSQRPCSGIDWCIRRRISSLISLSLPAFGHAGISS